MLRHACLPQAGGSDSIETIGTNVNDRGNPAEQSRVRTSLEILLFGCLILVGQVGWVQWTPSSSNIYYNGGMWG
jgi:hypothetical protein